MSLWEVLQAEEVRMYFQNIIWTPKRLKPVKPSSGTHGRKKKGKKKGKLGTFRDV